MKALASKTVRKVIALLLILMVSGTGNVFADVMYYVHTDHLGTPVVITDSTQKNVWQGNKQPFGKTDVSVNLIEFNVRFLGQYYDAESGLHYNYFRDYDPSLGRYVQSDPIGLAGGMNTYAYVGGNPLSYIDPTGENQLIVGLLILGAAAVGVSIVVNNSNIALNSGNSDGSGSVLSGPQTNTSSQDGAVSRSCPPRPGNQDPCKGLRDQLAEHQRKLSEYLSDPLGADNTGSLAAAMSSGRMDVARNIMNGRVKNLEGQIENFGKLLRECEALHGS